MPRKQADIASDDILDRDDEVLDFTTIQMGGAAIEVVTPSADFTDKLEYERFMQEPMVVRIPAPTDPNAPRAVYVGSNGQGGWLPYDKQVRIRRAYVENLLRSVESSIHTKDNTDPSADNGKIQVRRSGSSYPFEVVDHGSNPDLSRRWMKRIVAEARR